MLKQSVKIIVISIIIILVSFSAVYSYTGEAGPPMLKMIYGSRVLSLGGAFVGLADDVFYIDSNPAGGDTRSIYKVSILHQEWIEDVNYEAVRIAFGFQDRFFCGAGFTYLYLPFTYYDYYGWTSGQSHIISQSLGIVNFGYTFQRINISVGGNIKVFYNYVPEELYAGQSYLLFASDIGAIARTNIFKLFIGPEPSLTFGLAIKNIGYSGVIEKLPIEVHAGVSYRLLRNLLFTTEIALPFFEPIYGSLGAELDFNRRFFLEAGVQIKENPMFAVGFGYKREDFRINVSYTPSIAFYNMISVSLSYYFGETKVEGRPKMIEDLLIKAGRYFRDEKYEEALEMVDEVLGIEPENRRAILLKDAIKVKMKLEEELKQLKKEKSKQG